MVKVTTKALDLVHSAPGRISPCMIVAKRYVMRNLPVITPIIIRIFSLWLTVPENCNPVILPVSIDSRLLLDLASIWPATGWSGSQTPFKSNCSNFSPLAHSIAWVQLQGRGPMQSIGQSHFLNRSPISSVTATAVVKYPCTCPVVFLFSFFNTFLEVVSRRVRTWAVHAMEILLRPLLDCYFGHSTALFLWQVNWNICKSHSRQSALRWRLTENNTRTSSIRQTVVWYSMGLEEVMLCQAVCSKTQIWSWETREFKLCPSGVTDELQNILLHS